MICVTVKQRNDTLEKSWLVISIIRLLLICATVKERNDTLGKATWPVMGTKHCASSRLVFSFSFDSIVGLTRVTRSSRGSGISYPVLKRKKRLCC